MQISCNLVLDHPRLKIVYIDDRSFCESRLVDVPWGTNVVWLVNLYWYLPKAKDILRGLAATLSSPLRGQKVCVFINQPEEAEAAASLPGVRVAWVNSNTFASPRVFSIRESPKIYDAVVNASPLPFKRVHLCAKVERLCCIRRMVDPATPDRFDAQSLRPLYINHTQLRRAEVAALLNQSYCGVILSACEGACYASTEYLLCGLPVVSTRSVGGRHVWYDEANCILVEPDEDAVRDAVLELKRRILGGELSPAAIRENALKVRAGFIATAEEVIAGYLQELGLSEEVPAGEVVRGWLAEVDFAKSPLKHLASEETAVAYLRAGNLAYWRRAMREVAGP